jgi:hypothetical protein
MVFPDVQTKVVEGLERVDVGFDLPEAFIPEIPPLFVTTRPALGDVSRGQLIRLQNFEALFEDVLTPFRLDSLAERKGARKLTERGQMAMAHFQTSSTSRPLRELPSVPCYTDNLAHDLKVERFYGHVGSTPTGAKGPSRRFPCEASRTRRLPT